MYVFPKFLCLDLEKNSHWIILNKFVNYQNYCQTKKKNNKTKSILRNFSKMHTFTILFLHEITLKQKTGININLLIKTLTQFSQFNFFPNDM